LVGRRCCAAIRAIRVQELRAFGKWQLTPQLFGRTLSAMPGGRNEAFHVYE
jgi:hypothetical protein